MNVYQIYFLLGSKNSCINHVIINAPREKVGGLNVFGIHDELFVLLELLLNFHLFGPS